MNHRYLLLAATVVALMSVNGCKKEDTPTGGEDATERKEMFGEDLFTKYVDPVSGVVSYQFKNEVIGLGKINTQSNYFVTKSMTDDERFFFLFYSAKEVNGQNPAFKGGKVVDLKTGKLIDYAWNGGVYPYMDIKEDKLYYYVMGTASNGVRDHGRFYMKDLKAGKSYQLADFPSAISPKGSYIQRALSHITLTKDRRKVFLDAIVNHVFFQGMLDLYSGEWTEWSHNDTVHLTHGEVNPTRDDEALLAIDVWEKGSETIPIVNDPDGTYPRIQIMTSDGHRRTIKPSEPGNYATHEGWHQDGNIIYFCAGMNLPNGEYSGGFHFRNIRTNEYLATPVPRSTHCNPTYDMKYVVHDDDRPYGEYTTGYYRGGPWRVWFYNRATKKDIAIYSGMKPITTPDKPSTIHPDPHPHFVCNDKYIVCTAYDDEGYLHWSITPVDQLIKLSSK